VSGIEKKPIETIGQVEELLLSRGVVTMEDLAIVKLMQSRMATVGDPISLGELIVRMGIASATDIEQVAQTLGRPITGANAIALPAELIRRLKVMPVEIKDKQLFYASIMPLIKEEEDEILEAAVQAGHKVSSVGVYPKSRAEVTSWISKVTLVSHDVVQDDATSLCRESHDAPLMQRFIDCVFQDAMQERASDVHFERSSESVFCWISYRIDGVLRRKISMTSEAMGTVCTRVKALAEMDISETRTPQDGRFVVNYNGRMIDLRVSSVPSQTGETVTVRLLDQSQIHGLSFVFRHHPYVRDRVEKLAEVRGKSGGIVLVTGPTGQGKSTTLAAVLHAIPRTRLKVMTIEDPVEIRLPFSHQSSVNVHTGNTYATLLRAFMRQDPDVMMVGEIRDAETAQEFLKGAETGHLMLATEHTNDVASAIGRLLNLLPEDLRRPALFTISTSLRAVLNQRLVPALCSCAENDPGALLMKPALAQALGYRKEDASQWRLKKRSRCLRCDQTGYFGRELVVEAAFLPATGATRTAVTEILESGRHEELMTNKAIQSYSRIDGVKSLLKAGLIDVESAEGVLDIFFES